MKAVTGISVAVTQVGCEVVSPLAGGVGSVEDDLTLCPCLQQSSELAPLHLCPVRGQATGKSCQSGGVMVGRSLSGPINIRRQVVTAEAREGSVCCSSMPSPPLPPMLPGGLRTPVSQCTYTCLPEPLGAHWSCSQCWWRGGGRTRGRSIFLPLWQDRKMHPDGAHPQPTTSGLHHPIRPHCSFCPCDLSSSLSLESVTHRSVLTAFLLGLLECMSGPVPLCLLQTGCIASSAPK